MSLAKLKLNPLNINNLYTNNLISGTTSVENVPISTINYLGKNAKHITIVVNDATNFYLNDDDFSFLTKMLTACKLTIEDVAIVNISKTPCSINDLSIQLQPQKLLLFGVGTTHIDMPMIFPEYKIQLYNNMQCLAAATLQELSTNTNLKTQLWNCFKQIFAIH